eukprot:TRINITY_DN5534_c0_g1_i2.p1 TRINITY_DN5534_c0_g1~~TRINITY_DN5534_c0_g1_i2.p1  ORF type:complete len:139 (-),score=7.82 TRINITY_DN5534_c0_g1_i2:500-868(-)
MASQACDYTCKLVLVGTMGTGKSSLVRRLAKNTFVEDDNDDPMQEMVRACVCVCVRARMRVCRTTKLTRRAPESRVQASLWQDRQGEHCAPLPLPPLSTLTPATIQKPKQSGTPAGRCASTR